MEWPNIDYSPLEESLHGVLGGGWTYEENKVFEKALAEEIHAGSPGFFESVASKIPWKSTQEIETHYQALIEDLNMIESGQFPVPEYQLLHRGVEGGRPSSNELSKKTMMRSTATATAQRRRGIPWTEEEHQLFLMGLNKYGKGDWRSISRYYVITKTPTQVASHAQKYFRRQTSSTPVDRRRPSIHDIQTVNPPPPAPALLVNNNNNNNNDPAAATSSSSAGPMLHYNFNAASAAAAHHHHPNNIFSTGSFLFPSLGDVVDQHWAPNQ